MANKQILDNVELWNGSALTAEGKSIKACETPDFLKEDIELNSNLQLISIRLPKDLIDDLKLIAKDQSMGYQALTREVLKRFVAAEKRAMYRDLLKSHEDLQRKYLEARAELEVKKPKQKKTA